MNATPLTIDNIKKDRDAAMAAPVNIYVERVAAKVVFPTPPFPVTAIFIISFTSKIQVQVSSFLLFQAS